DLQQRLLSLKQEQLPSLAILELPRVRANGVVQEFSIAVDKCQTTAQRLCVESVEAEMIARLRDNSDIAAWVETGRQIHTNHNSSNCEYCGSAIAQDRLSQLARHFNAADTALKADIDGALSELRDAYSALNNLQIYDIARLYGDLRPAYEVEVASFQE